MEVDLNHQTSALRQMNKEKLETIAKWTEKFEMSERLVASQKEAEERLKEVQKIEMDTQKGEYERQLKDLQAELDKKQASLEDFNKQVS